MYDLDQKCNIEQLPVTFTFQMTIRCTTSKEICYSVTLSHRMHLLFIASANGEHPEIVAINLNSLEALYIWC